MKVLQKILMIVMIAFAWNMNGMRFSDPRPGPPALTVNPGGGIPAGRYVDFTTGRHHIYFPANGAQPAIAHIGQLAKAVNNGVANSPTTKWYVEAFGGHAALNAAYAGAQPAVAAIGLPQMGFAVPVAPAHIITVNAGGGATPHFAQDFWQEFSNIASTAAGRGLLYKILIEIRRIDTTHGDRHCYASGTERVGGMSLTVTPGANIAFVNKGSITFDNAHHAQLQGVLEQYYSFLTTLATHPNDPHNPVLQTPHFVDENVINVPGATTANDQFTHIQIPIPGGVTANADIYFPIDGHQPTTPNAVVWSCANIDNRENSPITEWYMQMFGVIPFRNTGVPENDYIKAGWTNFVAPGAPAVQRIMTFHATITNANMINDPDYGGTISGENLFTQNFRKIASTSVGRTLLYRILIEIRRHIANNIGAIGNDASGPVTLLKLRNRNECRKLEIRLSDEFEFDDGGYISICNFKPYDTAIGKEENGFSRIVKQRIPLDVPLFHEMNHWYHFLRDIVRFDIEYNRHRRDFNSAHQAARIVQHYWNGVVGGNAAISGENWEADNRHRIDFEEIRNILGVSAVAAIAGTISGDDLSENLYRMCIGVPLRFGYSDRTYYEDNLVINRVVESCISYREYYNCIPKALGEVDFAHGNNNNRPGLGNCRIFP